MIALLLPFTNQQMDKAISTYLLKQMELNLEGYFFYESYLFPLTAAPVWAQHTEVALLVPKSVLHSKPELFEMLVQIFYAKSDLALHLWLLCLWMLFRAHFYEMSHQK
jgi:hypothetical protein